MPKASRRLVALLAAAILAVAGTGYLIKGTPDYAEQLARAAKDAQPDPHAAAGMPSPEELEGMIGKLVARLQSQPDDVDGWLMLGRVRAVQGRFDDALDAYGRAEKLRPDDVRRLVDQADLLGAKNKSLAGKPAAMIERALQLEPDHPKALALAGTVAFDAGQFALAVKHWERLLAVTDGQAAWQAQVRQSIAEARQLGKLPGAEPAAAQAQPAQAPSLQAPARQAAAPAAAGAPTLSGTVSLSGALVGKASPEDTMFIYARAAQGPRMPLVILKKQVKDLPLTFTLDNSMAMSPAMNLATVSSVIVMARISKSGQAAPQPGDLLAESPAVAVGSQDLKLVIDQVVK